jgi:hypothetical protein
MSKKRMWISLCWIIVGTVAFYLLAVLSLWFIYSMGTMVSGGTYTLVQARSLVLRMALVTTSLTVIGVICARVFVRATSVGKATAATSLATGCMLTSYTVLNVLWRNEWQPGSGRAPFLPPWSELNASFFYEYNWLSYLIFLTPAAMIFSACISFWFWRKFALVNDA